MSPSPESRSETGADLVRGVALILAAGLALGFAYNALQRGAGSTQALAWVREEVRLASLEGPAAAPDSTAAETGDPAAASAGDGAQARVEAVPAHPGPPARSPDDAPPAQERAPHGTAPAPAAASAAPPVPPAPATAPAPDALPDVPESNEPREVSYALAKRFHDAGAALFVDARTRGEFAEGHIPGARSLPFDDVFERPELARQLEAGARPIIAYCGSADCNLSRDLAFALVEGGHRRVLVFRGGIAEWRAGGAALDEGGPAEHSP